MAGPSPRVLCYAPYNRWALHGMWEMTMLHGLRQRGAEVQYVLCDGLYTDCDQFWAVVAPRPANACVACQASVTQLVQAMGMDFTWLGRYLTTDEQRTAAAWARELRGEEVLAASYGDWPVGEWMRASVQSHLRASVLGAEDPATIRAARSYAYSGLIACFALDRLLAESQPDVLLLFNGRQSSTRVALELARRRGIRIIVHERGPRDETVQLTENDSAITVQPMHRYWREWSEVPLTGHELADVQRLLDEREHGRNTGWRAFTGARGQGAEILAQLGLDGTRPIWAMFTSSDDEVSGHDDYRSAFGSQIDWIRATIAEVTAHPEVQLVIRVHPNTGSRRSRGANRRQLDELAEIGAHAPANVHIVAADAELSAYALMDLCTVGLVWASTAGLELACRGKAVLSAAGSVISETSFVVGVPDVGRYPEIVARLRTLPLRVGDPEVRRRALRHAYGLFFRMAIDFPLVEMPDPHEGRLRYTSLDQLRPGSDPGLDRCARIILDGEAVCPPPTAAQRARTTGAEDGEPGGDPVVSVVVTCFNYARYLPDAVTSVLAQTFRDFELLIVDDGSTDDSLAVARSLAATDPRITVIAQENSGQPAIPRNNAIARARGRYVLCLDADDHISADVLARSVPVLDADPGVGVAYYAQQDFGESERRHEVLPWSVEMLRNVNVHHCAAVFRREAWVAAGGYSLNVRGYEDWDLWLGIAAAGYVSRWVPGPLLHYRIHGAGVYGQSTDRDQGLKAQIVCNRSSLFDEVTRAWAEGVLAGDPAALAVESRIGVMPQFLAVAARVEAPAPPPDPPAASDPLTTASTIVLAFAAELVAQPALLEAYAANVSAADDACLLIVLAEGADPAALIAAVRAAGLDEPATAELIAVPSEPESAQLLLSQVAHGDLERIDDRDMSALCRMLAAPVAA